MILRSGKGWAKWRSPVLGALTTGFKVRYHRSTLSSHLFRPAASRSNSVAGSEVVKTRTSGISGSRGSLRLCDPNGTEQRGRVVPEQQRRAVRPLATPNPSSSLRIPPMSTAIPPHDSEEYRKILGIHLDAELLSPKPRVIAAVDAAIEDASTSRASEAHPDRQGGTSAMIQTLATARAKVSDCKLYTTALR